MQTNPLEEQPNFIYITMYIYFVKIFCADRVLCQNKMKNEK